MTDVVAAVPVKAAAPESSAVSTASLPDRNVLAGGTVGVIIYVIQLVLGHFGWSIPPELQPLLPIVIGYIITYFVPPSAKDVAKRLDDSIVKLAAQLPTSQVSTKTVVVPETTTVIPKAQI